MDLLRPTFYLKELDLVMSRSTGPGRYDPSYEERGIDYPLPYVRWTERRNMEAVLQLIAEGTLRVGDLVAGEFPADQAPAGYGALTASGRGVAVLLRYAADQPAPVSRGFAVSRRARSGSSTTRVALVATGEFARKTLLLALRAKDALAAASGTALAIYRVNARALPSHHWLRDPVEGGGLVLAEGCHFFDLVCWLLDEEPESVQAMAPPPSGEAVDEIVATIRFSTGSIATIVYSTSGHPSLPKERIEVLKGGRAVVLDDFRTLLVAGKGFRAR